MNQFDATASLPRDAFSDEPDLAPYDLRALTTQSSIPAKALKPFDHGFDWKSLLKSPKMDDPDDMRAVSTMTMTTTIDRRPGSPGETQAPRLEIQSPCALSNCTELKERSFGAVVCSMKYASLVAMLTIAAISTAIADGPADNVAEQVRAVPPPGITVPPEDAARLKAGLARLDDQLAGLRSQLHEQARAACRIAGRGNLLQGGALRRCNTTNSSILAKSRLPTNCWLAEWISQTRWPKESGSTLAASTRHAPGECMRMSLRSTAPSNPTGS